MRFEILNVEHGFCAYAIGSAGDVLLFDCGCSMDCRPSQYLPSLGIRRIHRFFVTNYDEDHIRDLCALRQNTNIDVFTRNPSLSSGQLRALKTPPISRSMNELLCMMDSYNEAVTSQQLEPSGLRVAIFHNEYPTFADTNNLSLLIFLDIGSLRVALTGDLEMPGWLELLRCPNVQAHLGRVEVFIASHHGRDNGYCREVFDYCHPSLIVMSDGPVQYDTQLMASVYSSHASGSLFNTSHGPEYRKVITTRRDGNIFWENL